MEIRFLTIVLDGMPWITRHWPEFEKLTVPWKWFIVEGVAAPEGCTNWCKPIAPRLSNDGTTQYLDAVASYDPRLILFRKELWRGKAAMCNEPLKNLFEPCLLWEIDADELWTAKQIEDCYKLLMKSKKNCARFFCDYRVGRDWHITSRGGYGNNSDYEWHRVWKINQWDRFKTHEPPKLENYSEDPITQEETEAAGLVFRHEAYSTPGQIEFKQIYYGSNNHENGKLYANAMNGWKALQHSNKSKVNLIEHMPWVGKGVVAERISTLNSTKKSDTVEIR